MKELSDWEICELADEAGLGLIVDNDKTGEKEMLWYDGDLMPFARAVLMAAKPSQHNCSFVEKDGQLWVQKGTNEVMIWIANLEKKGEQQD